MSRGKSQSPHIPQRLAPNVRERVRESTLAQLRAQDIRMIEVNMIYAVTMKAEEAVAMLPNAGADKRDMAGLLADWLSPCTPYHDGEEPL